VASEGRCRRPRGLRLPAGVPEVLCFSQWTSPGFGPVGLVGRFEAASTPQRVALAASPLVTQRSLCGRDRTLALSRTIVQEPTGRRGSPRGSCRGAGRLSSGGWRPLPVSVLLTPVEERLRDHAFQSLDRGCVLDLVLADLGEQQRKPARELRARRRLLIVVQRTLPPFGYARWWTRRVPGGPVRAAESVGVGEAVRPFSVGQGRACPFSTPTRRPEPQREAKHRRTARTTHLRLAATGRPVWPIRAVDEQDKKYVSLFRCAPAAEPVYSGSRCCAHATRTGRHSLQSCRRRAHPRGRGFGRAPASCSVCTRQIDPKAGSPGCR
jgi:hypothetical protein